jgi:hypothetical protein
MKFSNLSIRCSRVSLRATAAASFALTLAVLMSSASQAQDASKDRSSWDTFDSVLILPPVYRPDAKSAPADPCTGDCSGLSNTGIGEPSNAVAGTADDPANASAGTADNPPDESLGADGSTPDESGWQEQQPAPGADAQNADDLESSLGSVQSYEEQEADDAAELSNYGIVPAPSIIIGVPVGPYYQRRSLSSTESVFLPMASVAPRASFVPHGVPGRDGGFPRRFFGDFREGSFSHMSGFHGRFGHR